jgi:hypothetical protein
MRPRAFTYLSLAVWMAAMAHLAFVAITTNQSVHTQFGLASLFLYVTVLSYECDCNAQRIRELESREFHTLCSVHDVHLEAGR